MYAGKCTILAVLFLMIATLSCQPATQGDSTASDDGATESGMEQPRETLNAALPKDAAKEDGTGEAHEQPADKEPDYQSKLSEAEKTALRTWFKREYSVEKAAEIGGICLKHGLSRERIIRLIGEPRHQNTPGRICYNFAPSQLLAFEFDEKGNLVAVKVTGTRVNADGSLPGTKPTQ